MSYAAEVNKKFVKEGSDYLHPTDMSRVALRLETTNICNHACHFCPNRKLNRKRVFIDSDLARRVITEAYDMGVRKGGFFIMGEPLINDDTLKLYEYASHCQGGGYTSLFLTTNGSLATEDKIKEIFASGVTSLKFSINGGTRESYMQTHGRDDYDKVMAALRYARKYRDDNNIPCRILSSYIVTKDNVMDIKTHYQRIKDYVDDFAFFGMATFASSVLEDTEEIKTEFDAGNVEHVDFSNSCPCALLENSINVTCEGYLHLCVTDPHNYAAIEDLHQKSLKDAWYGERMTEIRKMHMEQDIKGTVCNNCVYRKNDMIKPFNENLFEASNQKTINI